MPESEFDIIERYFSGISASRNEQVLLGPGDDCALLDVPKNKHLVVSTDTLISGVHFPVNAAADVVAHRCLGANLSDLAAMGALPFAFTLALTLPADDEAWLTDFSRTLASLVERYEIPLVGGNLARGELSITMTVMGTLPPGKGLLRSGAQAGDSIYVSGTLGDAGGGLALLNAGAANGGHLAERYFYPLPRLALGQALLELASAAIDISDGLGADLGHICERSGVGAQVNLCDLPISESLASAFPIQQAQALAVGAGDDYELCFTADPALHTQVLDAASAAQTRVTRIGEVVAGERVAFLDESGNPLAFDHAGYQHFNET